MEDASEDHEDDGLSNEDVQMKGNEKQGKWQGTDFLTVRNSTSNATGRV